MTIRNKFTDYMPQRKGSRHQKATCGCGHKGKSQNPEFYQCTACYSENWSEHNLKQADKLEARAKKLRKEAAQKAEQAAAFRARHGHKEKGFERPT